MSVCVWWEVCVCDRGKELEKMTKQTGLGILHVPFKSVCVCVIERS